jgi:hypothetical protein
MRSCLCQPMCTLGSVNGMNVSCSCVYFSYYISFKALLLVHKSFKLSDRLVLVLSLPNLFTPAARAPSDNIQSFLVCLFKRYRVGLLSPNGNRDGE